MSDLKKQVLNKLAKENGKNDSWASLKKHWMECFSESNSGLEARIVIDYIERAVVLALEAK